MALIACRCPHCGGEVNMEENMESGFCVYCGNKVINQNISKVKVAIDRSSEIVNTLSLAKSYLYDKDTYTAQNLLRRAMEIDSRNSDVWYMDAVLDVRNRKADLERAKQFPSLGIFSHSDYNSYKNMISSENGKVAYLILAVFGFMGVFATIPISIVFGLYWLTPVVLAAVIVIALIITVVLRRKKTVITDPNLVEAHEAALSHVTDEEKNKLS